MGDGKLFALVRGDAIYVAYVRWGNALWVGSPSVGHVQEVSFPESTPMSRGAIGACSPMHLVTTSRPTPS
jgi:myo-inositol-hexaphosphate 3-phosphohydrolase